MNKYTLIIFLCFFVFAKDSVGANANQICQQIPLNPQDDGFCQCIETNVGNDEKVAEMMLFIKENKSTKELLNEWFLGRYFQMKSEGKQDDEEFSKRLKPLGQKKAERLTECMFQSVSQMKK